VTDITAGKLRDKVRIRRQVNTKTATGGLARSWETVTEEWAEVRSINGREAIIGNTLQGVSTFQLTIRYRSDIKTSDQVVWLTSGDRELNIHTAEDRDGRKKFTVIIASTLAPQGA